MEFCTSFRTHPLPASENNLCMFASHLAHEGLSHQTIKSYLSAVKHLQIEMGLGDPSVASMPVLEHVLRGIKKENAKKIKKSTPRLPITPDILLKLRTVWEQEPSAFDNIMVWAACCTCYFGFLRSGEICAPPGGRDRFDPTTHLCLADISVDSHSNTSVVSVKIKASKTDPFRLGNTVFLGATGTRLCPVNAILAYTAVRGNNPGPLFYFHDKSLLTRDRLVNFVRTGLQKAGLNPEAYAGHSFRIGAATTAHAHGIDDSTIMTLGRWKSNAYQRYVRIPKTDLAKISTSIARPPPSGKVTTFQPMESSQ